MRALVSAGALALLLVPRCLVAQGTLSTQGFGYPPGQLSARAAATGGGLAELDPASPINPAALASWQGRAGIFFQYSPEFRRVEAADSGDKATVARFPLVGANLRLGERWILGLTASTFLDRSWRTILSGTDTLGGDVAPFSATTRSSGAISDFRLAASWSPRASLRLGVAGHVLAGANRRLEERVYTDSGAFAPFSDRSTVSYSGRALSAGAEWRPATSLAIAASGRVGGALRAFRGDTTLSDATVPGRFGAGAQYTGVAGTTIAASAEWTEWSRITSLAESDITVHDAWDVGVGAEVKGPDLFGAELPLRAGFRWRTLPFGVGTGEVKERIIALGTGAQFARNRAAGDLTLERATRSGISGARERAWILSVGFTVRP